MAILRHENIKILQNALQWRKNGVLSYIVSDFNNWLSPNVRGMTHSSRLRPVLV
jgi:hypothetical protein